jgi:hypothetical protein
MKPTVIYTDALKLPRVGERARVRALNHPRFLAGTWITTSRVESIESDRFETQNSRYVPGIVDSLLSECEDYDQIKY